MKRGNATGAVSALVLVASAGLLCGCESTDSQRHATTEAGQAAYADPTSSFAWRRDQAQTAPAPGQPVASVHATPEPTREPASTWLAIPTGQRETSALLLEKFAPREVTAGEPFEYSIRVTNLTGMTLNNVLVSDSIPDDFGLKSSDPPPRQSKAGDQGLTWDLGSLDGHESRTIRLTGSGSMAGSIRSCTNASYATALCSTINIVQPALRLIMAAPAQVLLCDSFEIKLTVANTGTGSAGNVHIVDAMPSGLRTVDGADAAEFTVPTLGAGESKDFVFRVKADRAGPIVNGAAASADAGLKAQAEEVTTRVTQPVLEVVQKAPERVFLGRPVVYEITVTNTGDAPANQTVLECPIPEGSTFESATDQGSLTNGSVTWSLGRLDPRDSRTVRATLNAATAGELRNAATARAVCATPANASAIISMQGVPGLMLNGSDDPDPVEVGEQVVYTLVLTNQGSAPLTNVHLVCSMDENDTMQFVSTMGPDEGTVHGRDISFPPLPKLDPKAQATYKVTIRAAKEGQVQFRAEATSDQITRPLVKIETTNFYK